MRHFIGILLGVCLSFNAYGEESAMGDIAKHITEEMKEIQELMRESGKLMQIMIDCELNDLCIYNQYEDLSKDTKNPMLKIIVSELLERYKDEGEWLRESYELCEVPALIEVKKALTKCLAPMVRIFELSIDDPQAAAEASNKIVAEYSMCVTFGLDPMLEKQNAYAMSAMLDLSERMGMSDSDYAVQLKEKFVAAQENLTNPEKIALDKCMLRWE